MGGETWTFCSQGLSYKGLVIRDLVFDPQDSNILYAATYDGIFKSIDGGVSWEIASNGITTTVMRSLAIHPDAPCTIYAGTHDGGIFKSTDCGESWSAIQNGLTNFTFYVLAIHPSNSDVVYAV